MGFFLWFYKSDGIFNYLNKLELFFKNRHNQVLFVLHEIIKCRLPCASLKSCMHNGMCRNESV